MSLDLDKRQRAMLREMGIRLWQPQPVAVEGVRGLLGRCADLKFAGAVASLGAAFELARSMNPAAVVIDKAMGTPAIIDWLHHIGSAGVSAAPVVRVSDEVDELMVLRPVTVPATDLSVTALPAPSATKVPCVSRV